VEPLTIRLYQPEDLEQLLALDALVTPYRPEDQPDVEAMFARAQTAKDENDRWAPVPFPSPGLKDAQSGYLALWVALLGEEGGPQRMVGMVGVGKVNYQMLPAQWSFTQDLRGRDDFLELQHLRIHPDFHRQGIGARLSGEVIAYAAAHGCRTLLLNTSVPQHPARRLYEKLGFREVARSFVGKYELIWMEKEL
jgi:ribosomal protein S18 acetylase RimI-like enzyme